jgi:chromate transporter
MKPAGLLPLGSLFAGLSLMSVGGANVLFPTIRASVVGQQGWLDAQGFAHLFAISQAAPGPNIMLASAIGWHVGRLWGLVVATVAILLPSSLLALGVGRLVRRFGHQRWLTIATDALVPLALGLMLASGLVAARSAGAGWIGYGVAAASAGAIAVSRLNPLIVMAMGTAVLMATRALWG